MDKTLDVWFSNSALKSNTLKKIKFYWNFIELYSSQNGCGHVCPLRNVTACKLMEETAIKGFPSHYSICFYQLKSQMKNIWLKANVLYQQLLSSVATFCPIRNAVFMIFVYWTIHQFIWSKIEFSPQI